MYMCACACVFNEGECIDEREALAGRQAANDKGQLIADNYLSV